MCTLQFEKHWITMLYNAPSSNPSPREGTVSAHVFSGFVLFCFVLFCFEFSSAFLGNENFTVFLGSSPMHLKTLVLKPS